VRLADLTPGPINLDDYGEGIAQLSLLLLNYPQQAGVILFKRRGATAAAFNLGRYADLKAQAMAYRKRGKISIALALERDAFAIYDRLPDFARW